MIDAASTPLVFVIYYGSAVTGDNRPDPPQIPTPPAEAEDIEPAVVVFVRSRMRPRVQPRAGTFALHRGKRLVAAWRPHA